MVTDDLLRYGLYFTEGIAAVVGTLFLSRIKKAFWKWFVLYLWLIFLTEMSGEYVFAVLHNPQLNAALYTWWAIPLQFIFFSMLFFWHFNRRGDKWVSAVCAVLYLAAWVADMVWLRHLQFAFTSFSYMTGNIVLLLQIILFFIRFTASNDILQYWQSQMFWVCIGLLVFYLATLPYFGLWNNLRKYQGVFFYHYWRVQMCLAACMYGFFSVSFIWNKKN